MTAVTIETGDWVDCLAKMPDESVQCCVTSPPYWGLRNYQVKGQLGLEKTPGEYIEKLVVGMREVRRVLRDDGTLWLNLGDSYARNGGEPGGGNRELMHLEGKQQRMTSIPDGSNLKPKDLVGIPWLAAFALRADGWYLRSEITWCKKAPMPESVTDRPSSATEKVFLLSKSGRYYYDCQAVRNPPSESFANDPRWKTGSNPNNDKNGYDGAQAQNPKQLHRMFDKQRGHSRRHAGFNERWDQMEKSEQMALGSNMRNYWLLGPEPFAGEHYATYPSEIPRKAILAGSKPGDMILDPFLGSGTTALVALELGRSCIGIELNPASAQMARERCGNITPGFVMG